MDWTGICRQILSDHGFHVHASWNTLIPHTNTEWKLHLPAVDQWDQNTLVLLNLQDWLFWNNGHYKELQQIEEFYGQHSHRVVALAWDSHLQNYYRGPVNLVYFSAHSIREIDRMQKHNTDWTSNPKTRAWQCLNGRFCDHRAKVYQILNTWPGGWLSYGNHQPLDQWSYETYRGTENDENFLRLKYIYETAAVNIVTETHYDHPSIVTEKTLFACIAQQVPIVIGYQGIVKDCESLGLDMFTDIVDTSYDCMPNDIRAEAALTLNRDLILGKKDLSMLRSRLLANRNWVMSNNLTDIFYNNLRRTADTLAAKLLSV